MQQIKQETGCDVIINGGLYNMTTFAPVAQLRVDGKTLVNENWGTNYGFGWDTNVLTMTANVSEKQNFIGCVCLTRGGKPVEKLNYPAEIGGARARTALGVMPDGKIWIYATSYNMTPEYLQQTAVSKGVLNAIMLDGGASTQGMGGTGGDIYSSRIVQNYICFFQTRKRKEVKIEK